METKLVRNCSATAIPSGQAVTLEAGTPVFITQTLGGNITARAADGLFLISSLDADALESYDAGESAPSAIAPAEGPLDEAVWAALKQCFDPEIPINIVDLGLVYDMRIEPVEGGKSNVFVKMTLTAQGCGMGPVIADDARNRILQLDTVEDAQVEIVWDPVWSPQMISPEGRSILGIS